MLFIGCIPLLAQEDEQRCFIGTIFALLSLVAYSEASPFKVLFNNAIAKAAQYVILVTYGSAAALATGVSSAMDSIVFGLLLLAVNLSMVLFVVFCAL